LLAIVGSALHPAVQLRHDCRLALAASAPQIALTSPREELARRLDDSPAELDESYLWRRFYIRERSQHAVEAFIGHQERFALTAFGLDGSAAAA